MADKKSIKPCPLCNETPEIGYVCGEYFVLPIGSCVCGKFNEMHSSEEQEIEAWNNHVERWQKTMFKKYCHGTEMPVDEIDETLSEAMKGCPNSKECNPDDCVFCEMVGEDNDKF